MKAPKMPKEIEFETLLDVNMLQQFQDMISKITGVAMLVIDSNGNPITQPTNYCRLCSDIIRTKEHGEQYCRELFFSMKDQHQNPYIGICPYSNLLYSFIDVHLNERILATWVIGQVRKKGPETRNLTSMADFTHTDLETFTAAYSETSEMDLDQFYEIAKFVHHYTEKLISNSYQMLLQSQLLKSAAILEEKLSTENTLFSQSLLSVGEGIILLDTERRILFMNPVAENLTGWKSSDIEEVSLKDIVKNCEPNERMINNKGLKNLIVYAKDGTAKLLSAYISIVKKDDSIIVGILVRLQSAPENFEDMNELIYTSNHDALTGLFNRGYLEQQLEKLDDEKFFPLSILMGDVNGLKFTNDVFGHYAGDHLLFLVSEAIKKNCPNSSVAARWGGDEFVILLPNTGEHTASTVAKNISEECSRYDADKLTISISFGYATKINSGKKMSEYLIQAENLMYENKTVESKLFKTAVINSIESRLFDSAYESLNEIGMLKKLSRQIAPYFNLSEGEMKTLELLAQTHDYGEIAINSYLLEKPSKLSKQEWKEVKKHPEIGYRIINTVTNHLEVGELVLTHHEYWNGKGYPMSLSHTQIPLLSRIFSVIDAYTAMTSRRPYRDSLTIDTAINNLILEGGEKYDPRVIDIFVNHVIKLSR